jgi:hypothetical protein
MTVVSRRRRAEAAVLGARWEGNTGMDGVSRCKDWERGVETVLYCSFYRPGKDERQAVKE